MENKSLTRRSMLIGAGSAVATASLGTATAAMAKPSALGQTASSAAGSSGATFPHTDPNNQAGWVPRMEFTDEFDGGSVNTELWHDVVPTWSTYWRWDAENVWVSDDTLKIRTRYNPKRTDCPKPDGWVQRQGSYNGNMLVSTEYSEIGRPELVLHSAIDNTVRAECQVSDLPTGIYTLRCRVVAPTDVSDASLSIHGADVFETTGGWVDPNLVRPIEGGGGSRLYVIDDIPIDASVSSTVTVAVQARLRAFEKVRFRDLHLARQDDDDDVNLLPNPGLKNRPMIPYDSGIIWSKHLIKYGYFEARVKGTTLPFGLAPAFWLNANDSCKRTEIDVVEIGQKATAANPDRIQHTGHVFRHPCLSGAVIVGKTPWLHPDAAWSMPNPPNADFHIYAVEWDEDHLTWYVDGEVHFSLDLSNKAFATPAGHTYFDQPLAVILSQGVRDPYRQNPTGVGFPSVMEVDYVRVWQKDDGHGMITSETDESAGVCVCGV